MGRTKNPTEVKRIKKSILEQLDITVEEALNFYINHKSKISVTDKISVTEKPKNKISVTDIPSKKIIWEDTYGLEKTPEGLLIPNTTNPCLKKCLDCLKNQHELCNNLECYCKDFKGVFNP